MPRSNPLKNLSSRLRAVRTKQPVGLGVGLNARPFDAGKMQYEVIRRRKRKQLLLWSLIAIVPLFFAALWFLLPTPLTYKAIKDYRVQSYRVARDWLTPLTWTSPEQFVIAFNSGTVDTRLGKYSVAQTELTRALSLAPANKKCMVEQNLVYSLDAHVASLQDQALGQNIVVYQTEAASIKANDPKCFPPAKAKAPIPDKGGGGGGGGGAQQNNSDLFTSAQQQQLEQKNAQGNDFQQQDLDQTVVNPNGPAVDPW